jgi:hypothetical protein
VRNGMNELNAAAPPSPNKASAAVRIQLYFAPREHKADIPADVHSHPDYSDFNEAISMQKRYFTSFFSNRS